MGDQAAPDPNWYLLPDGTPGDWLIVSDQAGLMATVLSETGDDPFSRWLQHVIPTKDASPAKD